MRFGAPVSLVCIRAKTNKQRNLCKLASGRRVLVFVLTHSKATTLSVHPTLPFPLFCKKKKKELDNDSWKPLGNKFGNLKKKSLCLIVSNIFPALEKYRDTITLCQSKRSYTRSIYIRERRASRRCRIHYKSRMHNRKGKNPFKPLFICLVKINNDSPCGSVMINTSELNFSRIRYK